MTATYTPAQRELMLGLAADAIREFLARGVMIDPPDTEYLAENRGVFVTLKMQGELRGCIGFPEAIYPLGRAIVKAAIYAATEDSRFYPVTAGELRRLSYEISVLKPARQISDVSEIVVGEHGLILTLGFARGLLLPQVPIEHEWDRGQYLVHICRKAGVRDDAWKDAAAKLEVFTAEVFGHENG
jgi:AmmeMemoRadiSam system protein A